LSAGIESAEDDSKITEDKEVDKFRIYTILTIKEI